jgi:uncharacterized protein
MIYLLVIVSVVILVSLVPISVILIGPKMLLMPERRKPEYYRERFGFSHPSQIGLHYESGTLLTTEGYKLSYWVVDRPECDKTKGAVIYLHGITDSKVSGLNYAKELSAACQRIYLIDMRRHGESEGEYCTYGYYEKHDVVRLIDRISAELPGIPISLLGNSMGAAIAIQVAAMDKRVSRVIAVAPFCDLFSIALDHEFRHIGIRNKLLLHFVLRRAEKIANFNASEVSPAGDMKNVGVPVLIVHGEKDKTVKRQYPQRLAELGRRTELIEVKGAGHVDVLEKGGTGYVRKLIEFLTAS